MSSVEKTHRFGLLTPSSNTVQEPEFSAALPAGVSLHTARVAYRDITPQEQMRCVRELESEGDRLSREAIASLFAKGIDPMVVIRWKDIFESLEQAIDSCETVAHILEGISLQNGRAY